MRENILHIFWALVRVDYFSELVKNDLWFIWAEQHAPYTQFLPRQTRKESNVPKLNSSCWWAYCSNIYTEPFGNIHQTLGLDFIQGWRFLITTVIMKSVVSWKGKKWNMSGNYLLNWWAELNVEGHGRVCIVYLSSLKTLCIFKERVWTQLINSAGNCHIGTKKEFSYYYVFYV